jgi:hypothetical protein
MTRVADRSERASGHPGRCVRPFPTTTISVGNDAAQVDRNPSRTADDDCRRI